MNEYESWESRQSPEVSCVVPLFPFFVALIRLHHLVSTKKLNYNKLCLKRQRKKLVTNKKFHYLVPLGKKICNKGFYKDETYDLEDNEN